MAASFMARKKKYKFHVEVCLEELLEVPFVSAVLFAKLRLLDGGGFQDHSSRQEVRDHRVQWNATFAFPCKMMANASTGVMERCVLRVSVRKECKGGRSFDKLGFVDLNLAEFAGAGLARRKALLEGYDARHRQDNSMLKFRIQMNMISGDILFKAPSPSVKHKDATATAVTEEETTETSATAGPSASVAPSGDQQRNDELSGGGGGGSLAGSVASASSGFGSLPKKRPQLLVSDLVQHQQVETPTADVNLEAALPSQTGEAPAGHSRNSSNTSQLSKVSGYASLHSRQSSSGGDSGHARNPSGGSVAPSSEPGSLERPQSATGKRKAALAAAVAPSAGGAEEAAAPPGRVEITRVDTDVVIEELLKSTNLEPPDDQAETSGLQLFIAKDGTAALGNHEVKQQMGAGAQLFQQVVVDAQDR